MASDDRTAFQERLTVPWWAWPTALALATGLALEIGLGGSGSQTWLPLAVLIPAALAVVLWLAHIKITVTDSNFYVDDACLPRGFIADVEVLRGVGLRDALSAGLHPVAFVIQRPWLRSAVRVWLDDPADPTPYWIVTTRRPEQLRAALGVTNEVTDSTGVEPQPAPHR